MGWKAVVMQNDLITIATMPAIGARIMQYDLGSQSSIFTNPAEYSKTYTPSPTVAWHNFGGYKTWPAPESGWHNTSGWNPPPTLDCGSYTYQIDFQTNDSIAVLVTSPIEKWFAPNIQFERRATIYPGTSRVKMDQTMINQGSSPASWSMWSVTQQIVNHPSKKDYTNFWAYFPINPNSVFGSSGVNPQPSSTAWKGEIEPGIYGVQFSPTNSKLFADPDKGWIAYANVLDSVVYAKTFDIFEDQTYPNSNARIAVWVNGSPAYMEVEITSPMVSLTAGGGRYTFTENWWAAKVLAPVLDVNSVGAIADKLYYDPTIHTLSARYGVFYAGTALVAFLDAQHKIVSEGLSHTVSPLAEFQLQESIAIPTGARTAELRIRNTKGELVGVLDSLDVSQYVSGVESNSSSIASEFRLAQNYPNPFNGMTRLTVFISKPTIGSLKIYDVMGREVALLHSGSFSAGEHHFIWNAENIASGVYLATLQVDKERQIQKMLYIR